MDFRTPVDVSPPPFSLHPDDRMLFVGSCFAASMGQRFVDSQFRAVVNPYGVMYNPVSIVHTLRKYLQQGQAPDVVVLTLGTNHVYVLKETGEVVDNCRKRPQHLFREVELSVGQCCDAMAEGVELLRQANPEVKVVFTVSPIRYAKYGFHGSQLSKATLLLAVRQLLSRSPEQDFPCSSLCYFPAYEIVCDELRDYRFYAPDMLHPSEQAVAYIWERLAQTYFAPETHRFLEEWQPIRQALSHKPFHPESPEYGEFIRKTRERLEQFRRKYHLGEPSATVVP